MLYCDWINDDMDGSAYAGPVWCGTYAESVEDVDTDGNWWACPNCGTEREIEDA